MSVPVLRSPDATQPTLPVGRRTGTAVIDEQTCYLAAYGSCVDCGGDGTVPIPGGSWAPCRCTGFAS